MPVLGKFSRLLLMCIIYFVCFSGSFAQEYEQSDNLYQNINIGGFDNVVRKAYLVSSEFIKTYEEKAVKNAPANFSDGENYATTYPENSSLYDIGEDEIVDVIKKASLDANQKIRVETEQAANEIEAVEKDGDEPKEKVENLDDEFSFGEVDGFGDDDDEESIFDKIFQQRADKQILLKKKKKAKEALYWEQVRKNYFKNKNKTPEESGSNDDKQEFPDSLEEVETGRSIEKIGKPEPQKKPMLNYKTQRLPKSINKKQYSKQNQHLPKVVYIDEYKKLLFNSVATGDLDVMRAMLDYFKDTEIRDREGNTALLYATISGNLQSVTSLLGLGSGTNVQNNSGLFPLYIATKKDDYALVKTLLRWGASPDQELKSNGETALIAAVNAKSYNILKIMLDKGAKINHRMRSGDTALHVAIRNNDTKSSYLLLKSGANTEIRNFEGYTPLMLSAATGRGDISNILLRAGADTAKRDRFGNKSSAIASLKGYVGVAQLIESEDIRRNMMIQKLAKIRKTGRYKKHDQAMADAPKPIKKPAN